jgi:copper chaperone CopZ
MERVEISVPSMQHERYLIDLGAALTGLSGVMAADFDLDRRMVSVTYEPALIQPKAIRTTVEGAGYPVEAMKPGDSFPT